MPPFRSHMGGVTAECRMTAQGSAILQASTLPLENRPDQRLLGPYELPGPRTAERSCRFEGSNVGRAEADEVVEHALRILPLSGRGVRTDQRVITPAPRQPWQPPLGAVCFTDQLVESAVAQVNVLEEVGARVRGGRGYAGRLEQFHRLEGVAIPDPRP
jgi:hypothetical protein